MNLDRNIVIEASAGTGKTYALVQTVLRALFKKGLPMESIVALTFTKKAAGEMKERIAAALQTMIKENKETERARQALESIDRAAISTIHSYAYSLLKRFPLAAGISADAEVDEKGVRGDDLFDEDWSVWIAAELNENTPRQKDWLQVLGKVDLSDVRELARRLVDFDVPLDHLTVSDANLSKDLAPYLKEIRALLSNKPDQKATKVAMACEEILSHPSFPAATPIPSSPAVTGRGSMDSPPVTAGNDVINEDVSATKAWPAEDIKRLKFLQNLTRNVVLGGDHTVHLLTELLYPFITRLRARMLAEGCLSNNALLYLARELVASNPRVRETLKREIQLILVDEFQDTDPLQGELILFLAEKPDHHAKRWQDTVLEAGKLFLVGDPKQSIYRFRGADIAAYRKITDHVLKQGGQLETLSQSRRSHDHIVHAVNAAFGRLIEEKPPVSPAYQALEPLRKRAEPQKQYVELRLATSQETQSSKDAIEREAEDAAAWIAERAKENELSYKDVALIFRSTPTMPPFIEALRRRNIPYVVEGERYFYGTPEVTDVLNLLRVLARPGDRLALAGFLRSPLGGFSDPELALLQQKNGLRLDRGLPAELDSPAHHGAWQLLRNLAARVAHEPLKAVLRHVYEDTFLLELAARSYHKDQTVANLLKLKRLMESFAEEGVTTLETLLAKIDRWKEDDRLEGESPLADEWYDAVRLLTIHKAKGLEFPVVWLPGLHKGRQGSDPKPDAVRVLYDWSTGRLGIRIGRKGRNLGHFVLEEEAEVREEAEERRVLYVAMTRARERLILSGGIHLQRPSKDSPLPLLAGAWDKDLSHLPEGDTAIGEAALRVHHISAETPKPTEAMARPTIHYSDPAEVAERWKKQEEVCRKAGETAMVVTPTSIVGAGYHPRPQSTFDSNPSDSNSESSESNFGQGWYPAPTLLGTLIHLFLEHWDFTCEKCSMPAQLRHVANVYFSGLGLLKQPFPDPKDASPQPSPDGRGRSEAAGEANPPELLEVVEEAQRLLADFIGSEAWEEIKNSEIIGREVPFFYKQGDALMRGSMDILYRTPKDELVIGDYKTAKELDASKYAEQGKAYEEAVSRALGEKPALKLIHLREGSTITLTGSRGSIRCNTT